MDSTNGKSGITIMEQKIERTIDGLLPREYDCRFVKQLFELEEAQFGNPESVGTLDLMVVVTPEDLAGHHMFGEAFRRVRIRVGRKLEDAVRPRQGNPKYKKRFAPAAFDITVPELDFPIELRPPQGAQLLGIITDAYKDNPFPKAWFHYRLRSLPHELVARRWLEGDYKVNIRPTQTQEEMFPDEVAKQPDVEIVKPEKEAASG